MRLPSAPVPTVVGFSYETIQYLLGGSIRGSYYTLNDNIINGRIRGVAGVVGCNNCRTTHDSSHLTLIKELIQERRHRPVHRLLRHGRGQVWPADA